MISYSNAEGNKVGLGICNCRRKQAISPPTRNEAHRVGSEIALADGIVLGQASEIETQDKLRRSRSRRPVTAANDQLRSRIFNQMEMCHGLYVKVKEGQSP